MPRLKFDQTSFTCFQKDKLSPSCISLINGLSLPLLFLQKKTSHKFSLGAFMLQRTIASGLDKIQKAVNEENPTVTPACKTEGQLLPPASGFCFQCGKAQMYPVPRDIQISKNISSRRTKQPAIYHKVNSPGRGGSGTK